MVSLSSSLTALCGSDLKNECFAAYSNELKNATASLPPFLKLSPDEIGQKFFEIEWTHRSTLLQSNYSSDLLSKSIGKDITHLNRYRNVFPFPFNRVHLHVPPSQCDYVNASLIELDTLDNKQKLKWIATQGPTKLTSSHFWRMLHPLCGHDKPPAIIIMLTQLCESGLDKCFPYFPLTLQQNSIPLNQEDYFSDHWIGKITLECIHHNPPTQSTLRQLNLSFDPPPSPHKPIKAWHFLFNAWPDNSLPQPSDSIALIRFIAMIQQASYSIHPPGISSPHLLPPVVHCSAGIGRSGTFIALYYLLHELDSGTFDNFTLPTDPIADVVNRLRLQRYGMVQTPSQYQFLYSVLRDIWLERWIRLKILKQTTPDRDFLSLNSLAACVGQIPSSTQFTS